MEKLTQTLEECTEYLMCSLTNRWQGQQDTPLNNRGREQAAALARRLAKEHNEAPFAAIFSSPLSRAVTFL